jgi:hypothetical protein
MITRGASNWSRVAALAVLSIYCGRARAERATAPQPLSIIIDHLDRCGSTAAIASAIASELGRPTVIVGQPPEDGSDYLRVGPDAPSGRGTIWIELVGSHGRDERHWIPPANARACPQQLSWLVRNLVEDALVPDVPEEVSPAKLSALALPPMAALPVEGLGLPPIAARRVSPGPMIESDRARWMVATGWTQGWSGRDGFDIDLGRRWHAFGAAFHTFLGRRVTGSSISEIIAPGITVRADLMRSARVMFGGEVGVAALVEERPSLSTQNMVAWPSTEVSASAWAAAVARIHLAGCMHALVRGGAWLDGSPEPFVGAALAWTP